MKTAIITATADVVGSGEEVAFKLYSPGKGKTMESKAAVEAGKATVCFSIEDPELWYPHGYGKQPLYKLHAALDGDVDTASKTLGLRKVRVVQRPLTQAPGLSFFFEVNNIPIWVGGSNWIPADSFLNRLDEAKYRKWLEIVKDGRQVMVR